MAVQDDMQIVSTLLSSISSDIEQMSYPGVLGFTTSVWSGFALPSNDTPGFAATFCAGVDWICTAQGQHCSHVHVQGMQTAQSLPDHCLVYLCKAHVKL